MLFRLLPILILSTVTTYSQSDTLKHNMDDFHCKNNIQLGVINGYGQDLFFALSHHQFKEFKPGIMYSRMLGFIDENLWVKASYFRQNIGYSYTIANVSIKDHVFSLGFNYSFKILKKKPIYFNPGIEYAFNNRFVTSHYFVDNSKIIQSFIANSVIVDFNFCIGKVFTFNISHDLGYGRIKRSILQVDSNHNETLLDNYSKYDWLIVKGLIFSIGYKF